MSNIPDLERELANKENLLKEWNIEANKLRIDKEKFELLQKEAKQYADENNDSDKYLKIINDYQSLQEKLELKQSKISNLESEITKLKERISQQAAFQTLLKEDPIASATKTYSFSVKDNDYYITPDDLVGGGSLRIDFFQIDFKPTNQKFWVPRNIYFDGSYSKAFSVVLDSAKVDYLGDAKSKLEAKIYIKLKIGGVPSSNQTSFAVNAEAGAEAKADVKFGEASAGVKVGLSFGKSWTNNFNGGAILLTFDLKYDCLKNTPTITRRNLVIPNNDNINALVHTPSGDLTEGELELMITDKKDNL